MCTKTPGGWVFAPNLTGELTAALPGPYLVGRGLTAPPQELHPGSALRVSSYRLVPAMLISF